MFGRTTLTTTAALAGALLASAAAYAAETIKPAVIYDLGGKFDKSFNEGVFNGATKFAKETGVTFRDLEIQNESQREQVLRKFAKDGYSPIIMPGFAWATALEKDRRRVSQDQVRHHRHGRRQAERAVDGVQGRRGFVPGRRDRRRNVEDRARSASSAAWTFRSSRPSNAATRRASNTTPMGKGEVIANMTGTTPAAWNDPVKGGELAKSQIDRGADIVYAAAGSTGQGVLKAAADAGKFGIGVDSNQNGLFPGKILTSMLKRVDVATYDSFMDAKKGTWKAGVQVFGLKNDGVGYAVDDNNKAHPDRRRQGQGGSGQGRHHLGQDPGPRLYVRQQVPRLTTGLLAHRLWPSPGFGARGSQGVDPVLRGSRSSACRAAAPGAELASLLSRRSVASWGALG